MVKRTAATPTPGTLPKISPIKLIERSTPFDDPNYIFELKYDGFRASSMAPQSSSPAGTTPTSALIVIRKAAQEIKAPQVNGLIRLAILLGQGASDWLWAKMEKMWGTHSQPPGHFFSFKEIRKRKEPDTRLAALRMTANSTIVVPGGQTQTVKALITDPLGRATLLSQACVEVFDGKKEYRQSARHLDVIAYGAEVGRVGDAIVAELAADTDREEPSRAHQKF